MVEPFTLWINRYCFLSVICPVVVDPPPDFHFLLLKLSISRLVQFNAGVSCFHTGTEVRTHLFEQQEVHIDASFTVQTHLTRTVVMTAPVQLSALAAAQL